MCQHNIWIVPNWAYYCKILAPLVGLGFFCVSVEQLEINMYLIFFHYWFCKPPLYCLFFSSSDQISVLHCILFLFRRIVLWYKKKFLLIGKCFLLASFISPSLHSYWFLKVVFYPEGSFSQPVAMWIHTFWFTMP